MSWRFPHAAHGVWKAGRTGTGSRLLCDLAVGNCLLQFGDARVGDLGKAEVELLQIGHGLEMDQPRVSDLSGVKSERLQIGQCLQMDEPLVGDLFGQSDSLQLGQPLEMHQPSVGDLSALMRYGITMLVRYALVFPLDQKSTSYAALRTKVRSHSAAYSCQRR